MVLVCNGTEVTSASWLQIAQGLLGGQAASGLLDLKLPSKVAITLNQGGGGGGIGLKTPLSHEIHGVDVSQLFSVSSIYLTTLL